MCLIIDAHEDIAFNAICHGRDYMQSARRIREIESARIDEETSPGLATLGLADWIEGRVAVVFATIFTEPARSTFSATWSLKYENGDDASEMGLRQQALYRRLAETCDTFRLIERRQDLEAVLASWDGEGPRRIGLVQLMENADPIRTPEEVDEWYDRGLRLVGPAWMSSRYCGGTGEPGPLTADGVRLLLRMQDLNMVLDTSHMAEASFFQSLERYAGPIVASHSNPRRFVDSDRQLSDGMIRALVERDGVIGLVPYNTFLVPGWRQGDAGEHPVPLATFIDAIEHVCQIAGSAQHAAIGSDLDGGFGAESTPEGLDTVADLQKIATALAERGYSSSDVDAITHENWLRVLRRSLP